MNTTSSSPAFLQKRRFYTVLPLLICPFLVLFFWLLGGGTAVAAGKSTDFSTGGLNLALPAAKLKDDSHLTKMDYYRKADQDSAKRRLLAKNDPYYRLPGLNGTADTAAAHPLASTASKAVSGKGHFATPPSRFHDSDRNEALVYRKLAALNATLTKKAPATPPATLPSVEPASPSSSTDVSRLEHLVQSLHAKDTTIDPDLRALSGMLDKIAAIQQAHPAMDQSGLGTGLASDRALATTGNAIAGLPADTVRLQQSNSIDTLCAGGDDQNGFYSADDGADVSVASNAIPAVIDQTVTVVNGASVPIRLLNDIRVKNRVVPTGCLAYGIVQMSGDRLTIAVKSIQYQQNIFPVSLTVYSPDGLPGIPAPSSVTRDVAKQSADAGVQNLGLTTLDQSIGAQATAAGIQAAKNLFSKKVRLVTVTLPAGYQVLLKDNAQH